MEKVCLQEGARMSAPSKADIGKLDRLTTSLEPNHVHIEVTSYVKPWERLFASRNVSEGVEPRNNQHCTRPRVSFPGSQYQYMR